MTSPVGPMRISPGGVASTSASVWRSVSSWMRWFAEPARGVEERDRGGCLLQRLATGEREALRAGGAHLRGELVDRHLAAAGGVVRGGVEATGAAERAALQPDHEPGARAIGAAARL